MMHFESDVCNTRYECVVVTERYEYVVFRERGLESVSREQASSRYAGLLSRYAVYVVFRERGLKRVDVSREQASSGTNASSTTRYYT